MNERPLFCVKEESMMFLSWTAGSIATSSISRSWADIGKAKTIPLTKDSRTVRTMPRLSASAFTAVCRGKGTRRTQSAPSAKWKCCFAGGAKGHPNHPRRTCCSAHCVSLVETKRSLCRYRLELYYGKKSRIQRQALWRSEPTQGRLFQRQYLYAN